MADDSRSESPLSDIGSDAFTEEDMKLQARSPSPSNPSDMSDADSDGDGSITQASTSTPRHNLSETRPKKRRRFDHAGAEDHPTPRSTNLSLAAPGSPNGSISSDSTTSVPNSPSFATLGPTHPLSTAYAAHQANPLDPDSSDYTQVTICRWRDCPTPNQHNMDNLVLHINEAHIPPARGPGGSTIAGTGISKDSSSSITNTKNPTTTPSQPPKKYFCQWETCTRQPLPHTSAYALKAHMRSHTKEKPFMCQVPECDRSFTRSDALAKHMRTVHETEALRPSDPVPRGHTGGILQAGGGEGTDREGRDGRDVGRKGGLNGTGSKTPKIKLLMKGGGKATGTPVVEVKIEGGVPPLPTVSSVTAAAAAVGTAATTTKPATLTPEESRNELLASAVHMDDVPFTLPVPSTYYPPEIYDDMDDYERDLPPSQWFRLLRRQIRWATEEGEALRREVAEMGRRTDDLRGNPVTRAGGDRDGDTVGDAIRREEWGVVEGLLGRIGGVGVDGCLAKHRRQYGADGVQERNGGGDGGADGDVNVDVDMQRSNDHAEEGEDLFARVQKLPFWKIDVRRPGQHNHDHDQYSQQEKNGAQLVNGAAAVDDPMHD